jgi:hypothetical protein
MKIGGRAGNETGEAGAPLHLQRNVALTVFDWRAAGYPAK